MEKRTIEISSGTIFRAVLIILAIVFLYLVRNSIALLFIAIIIVSAIDPAVNWLQRRKIPRVLGVAIIYVVLFSAIALTISFLVPPLVQQSGDFYQRIPSYLRSISNSLGTLGNYFQLGSTGVGQSNLAGNFDQGLSLIPGRIFTETVGFFSGIVSALIVMVMAFYMAVNEDGIKKFIVSVTPEKHKIYAAYLTTRIEAKMGKWMQGQFFLMLIIFALDAIGLYALGIPYALALAIFAGLMEIVPYVGPIISAVPGVILGLTISPVTGLLTLLLYVFVQQFENHIIVPQVMKKAVGLNPIAVILALLVGLELGGILGAILAVPIATVIGVVAEDFMAEKKPVIEKE